MKKYNLTPNDSHKSFYGKAIVKEYENGVKILQSYKTDVLRIDPDGKLTRLWNGWSATTGRHIKAFAGIGKAEYLKLELAK